MDRIEGRKITDIGRLGLLDLDAGPIVEELFRAYLRMILDAGVLHADPHPGNLLLTDDGQLALLDLGMTATVPPRVQDQVVKLLLSISDGDGEAPPRSSPRWAARSTATTRPHSATTSPTWSSEAVASGADLRGRDGAGRPEPALGRSTGCARRPRCR